MCESLNVKKLKNELIDQLNEDLNKSKLNKQLKQKLVNEIKSATIDSAKLILRQERQLIYNLDQNEKILESNLNNLINKEKDLLKKLEDSNNNYEEIINDYNELKSLISSKNFNFDYIFQKNENVSRIGNLMVNR